MGRAIKFILAIPFAYIFVLNILDYFYSDYFISDDNLQLSSETYIYIFVISIVLIWGLIYWVSSEKDLLIRVVKSLGLGVFSGFVIIFYIYVVAQQTTFYVNKTYAKTEIVNLFEVRNKNDYKEELDVSYLSVDGEIYFHTKDKIRPSDFERLKEGDTVKIKYFIGLLNKPFLPYGDVEFIE